MSPAVIPTAGIVVLAIVVVVVVVVEQLRRHNEDDDVFLALFDEQLAETRDGLDGGR